MITSFPVLSQVARSVVCGVLLVVCLALFAGRTAFAQTPLHQPKAALEPVAESGTVGAHAETHGEHKEEALTQNAPLLIDTPYFKFNSSMLITWIVALALIVSAQIATWRIKEVPEGAQNFWEWLVESLYNFLQNIIGPTLVKQTFWFFATVFIFILALNWFSLIPGVGTIGWGIPNEAGALTHISRPILRGPNADLNMTLAMSMIFFACWIIWAIKANGPGGFILHLFAPKGEVSGFLMKALMVVIFFCVGLLEIVSILFRPVSLSFRLFGNIFAGENTLETMTALGAPYFGWLLPLPFYMMELLVGFVQALVFMLLTAVFTLLIMPEEGHKH
ncbi:MAG: F0F1 ATP synthase subunit A [Verrucomicrobia bacterium]|nr:F0F1 ATP synthase subunit A [Verrucomicrobiota bacterium]